MDNSNGSLTILSDPSFPTLRRVLGQYLVDKTALIEKIVTYGMGHAAYLVLRPRRCGKSCMLHMLKSFFSFREPNQRSLFEGLYVASKPSICEKYMGKYAVIFLDFKGLRAETWDAMFAKFKAEVLRVYRYWEEYLRDSLSEHESNEYRAIIAGTVPSWNIRTALTHLSKLLARKSGRGVVVLIDDYEVPFDSGSESGYFDNVNEQLWHWTLGSLLKGNEHHALGVLVGAIPVVRLGWSSSFNSVDTHALNTRPSIFAGMIMFTEEEVKKLKELSKSPLELGDLTARYDSYLAADEIKVYNPVSIIMALKRQTMENFWVATGVCPLRQWNVAQLGPYMLNTFTKLLSGAEIEMRLARNISFQPDMSQIETLLYYTGYLTSTATDKVSMKIPNREVLCDWSEWVIRDFLTSVVKPIDIFECCVNGPLDEFVEKWPHFMQANLDPQLVEKKRGTKNDKTPVTFYHIFFLGLFHSLPHRGWVAHSEPYTGFVRGFFSDRGVTE